MLEGAASGGPTGEVERVKAYYERSLTEAQAQTSAALAQLDERTRAFERTQVEIEQRHEVLASLLELATGSTLTLAAQPLDSSDGRMINQASIEEADARQSRALAGDGARVQSVGFRARADDMRSEQEMALAQLENAVVEQSEQMRGVLRMTGVSLTSLTPEPTMDGTGGPLVPQGLVDYLRDSNFDGAFARRVEQVAARVAEARGLRQVVESTPLAAPVNVEHRETSGYGPRIDPFTGGPAFHSGLDVAAFHRAPVVATAGGQVSYAGWMGGYGNVVEIDHGENFRTRYAHLDSIDVRKGDSVIIGQPVGLMGSTGRSTATHLHYEVWYRGRHSDPANFLRAGRHVHEQG
jgi:murein DD-endopeptidase MepM/ murein hydrolase activator NlpD